MEYVKILKIADVREALDKLGREEITYSKMVELLNVKINEQLSTKVINNRLSEMIADLDNKVQNTDYDDGEHLAWDKDDIRCIQRTLQLLNDQ